jgi:hypothetical protein
MTPFEMEREIKNLNDFVGELRQILPLLATKEELRQAVAKLATKEDVTDARRYALMLNEATRDDIKLLAEHMVAMQAQLSGMQTQLARIERRLP